MEVMTLHSGRVFSTLADIRATFHQAKTRKNSMFLWLQTIIKQGATPPKHRLDVCTAWGPNHRVWIQIQGVVPEGEREANQEKPWMLLGRTKHSQKYTKPEPKDRQSNTKISLAWVKHKTQKTWNWDPRLNTSQIQRIRVLHIPPHTPP